MADSHDIPRENLDIGQVRNYLMRGHRLSRKGWNGQGMWVQYHYPKDGDGAKLSAPFLYLYTGADGSTVPWLASQADILADDWFLAD